MGSMLDGPRLCFTILVILLGTALTIRTQETPSGEPRSSSSSEREASRSPESFAKSYVKLLAREHFRKAVGQSTPVMKRTLRAHQMELVWTRMISRHGSFERILKSRTQRGERFITVFLTCQFSRNKHILKVVLTADKPRRVAGFFHQPPYRSPEYARPSAFEETKISFSTGTYELPGTLTRPSGDGPFPVLVLVHGSGPQDRDETIGACKPFRDLAHGLASNGIAVLRYDKRTYAYRDEIDPEEQSITLEETTIKDAVSAVKHVQSLENLHEEGVFVLGHSLGGMAVPRIAKRTSSAAGYIIMAGNARPLDELLLEQNKYLFKRDGQVDPKESNRLNELQKQVERVRDPDLSPETPVEKLPLNLPAEWWLYLRDYQPVREATTMERPLLILQGGRDYQVTNEDFRRWKEQLSEQSNVSFHKYPDLNHLFVSGSGDSTPEEYFQAGNVSDQVINDLTRWIKVNSPSQ